MRKSLAIVFLLFTAVLSAVGQDKHSQLDEKNWSIFTSPDKLYQLELPGIPVKTPKMNPGKTDETKYFRCTDKLESTHKLVIRQAYPTVLFQIGVFALDSCRRKGCLLATEGLRLVKAYSADDPGERVFHRSSLDSNGMHGFLFGTVNNVGTHIWDYFVETNGRIYWMYYVSNDPKEDVQNTAERIFRSFKVLSSTDKTN